MPIKISCAPMEVVPGRPDINFTTACRYIEEAKAEQVDLLILPELCLSGKLLGTTWEEEEFLADCAAYGEQLIAASQNISIIFGNVAYEKVTINKKKYFNRYNAIFACQNGKIIRLNDKNFYTVSSRAEQNYHDQQYFTNREQARCVHLHFGQRKLLVVLSFAEETELISSLATEQHSQLLVQLAAEPYTLQQEKQLQKRLSYLAARLRLPLLYCNQGGIQNTSKNIFTYPATIFAYDDQGQLLTANQAFSQKKVTVSWTADIGLIPSQKPAEPLEETAAIYQCLHYGTKKFLQQCGISKMTIGLSGGIDSAVTAALYADILGPENILLLNLPSVYNSKTTKNLAQQLAYNLGANYATVPIQDSCEHTIKQLENMEIRQKDALQPSMQLSGLVKENIQARDRGARVIAAAAAAFGGAFSCNSNKTEMSIGYCTFYGDLAGALALIGDLWKYQVYDLGKYLNEQVFQSQVIPKKIFTIRPSAELSEQQTVGTGGDPLIYDYHDHLFQTLMESRPRITPTELLVWYRTGKLASRIKCRPQLIKEYFPTVRKFTDDLEHWWKLFTGFSVAKRIQGPPIMSISSRPYGNSFSEVQKPVYLPQSYVKLKEQLLSR